MIIRILASRLTSDAVDGIIAHLASLRRHLLRERLASIKIDIDIWDGPPRVAAFAMVVS